MKRDSNPTQKPPFEWGARLKGRMKEQKLSAAKLADRMLATPDLGENHQSLVEKIYKWSNGRVDQPRGKMMRVLAVALDCNVQWLRDGSRNPESGSADIENAAHHQNIGRSITETLPGAVDLSQPMRLEFRRGLIPYRGRVMASKEGYLNFSGAEPTEYIEAPPGLAEVEGAYAVRVVDRSMVPVLKPGMVCCVDPRLEPMADDECIVQLTDDHGITVHGFVKRFVSMNNRILRVQQFNPEKIIEIPRKQVFAVHRVVWSGRPY